ncbi:MAG TPA: YdcF family protein, partial [Candidatus Limnocylindrales bacterium]|nr:YdcF family protein [Candidatus Limnocylindrales bacterium]
GVPPERILMEEEGRTTLESIRAVADLLHAAGIRDAIFVSDRTHMLRVLRIARDEGIVAWGSPTPFSPIESSSSLRWQATVHELAALAYYFLTGAASILRLAAP